MLEWRQWWRIVRRGAHHRTLGCSAGVRTFVEVRQERVAARLHFEDSAVYLLQERRRGKTNPISGRVLPNRLRQRGLRGVRGGCAQSVRLAVSRRAVRSCWWSPALAVVPT